MRRATRKQLLELLCRQSAAVLHTGDWTYAAELRELAQAARQASPRAKSFIWGGIRFPIRHGIAVSSVRHPHADIQLVGFVSI